MISLTSPQVSEAHKQHHGQNANEAMLEYLKIAQNLETHGVNYYRVVNEKRSDIILGIDSLCIHLYREVQMHFAPEIFKHFICCLRDPILTIDRNTSLKQHIQYFNFRSTIQLIHLYSADDKFEPRESFPWSEVAKVKATDKGLIIKLCHEGTLAGKETKSVKLLGKLPNSTKKMKACADGNHKMYKRRRMGFQSS